MKLDLQDRASILKLLVAMTSIVIIFIMGVIIISPFLPAIILALILTLATWPAFRWMERQLNFRTTLAALLMTVLLGIFFLIPVIFMGATLVDSFKGFITAASETFRSQDANPPLWLENIPVLGDYADSFWDDYVRDKERIPTLLQQHSGDITQKLIAVTASIGRGVLDVFLSVVIAFFMFRHGVFTASRLTALIENFGGPTAIHLLSVSKGTLIAVVYGVVGTAVAQGVAAIIGFWVAGVPGAPFLGLITFIISFIPGGPPFVWLPATLWLLAENETGAAIFLGIWGFLIISGVDNVLRPYFISLGTNLPLILVLLGVVGGIIAFGFIGLFVGPTLLAVAYALILEWSNIPRKPKGDVLVIEKESYKDADISGT